MSIEWKDFELSEQTLNPNTLQPVEDEDNAEHDNKTPKENSGNAFESPYIRNHEDSKFNYFGNSKKIPFQESFGQRIEMMNMSSQNKNKLFYLSFTEKYPHMNFRSLSSTNKNKYSLSEAPCCKSFVFSLFIIILLFRS